MRCSRSTMASGFEVIQDHRKRHPRMPWRLRGDPLLYGTHFLLLMTKFPNISPSLRKWEPTSPRAFPVAAVWIFRCISHLLRHFLSSALAWRHTSSNSVTRNYCCRDREVTLVIYGHVNRSYLLTYKPQVNNGKTAAIFLDTAKNKLVQDET